jgi:hypothetical protein
MGPISESRAITAKRAGLGVAAGILLVVPVVAGWQVAGAADLEVAPVDETGPTSELPDLPSPGNPVVVESGTGQEPVTADDALTPRPADEATSRIRLLRDDGTQTALLNGDAIQLGDGIEVAVSLSPYPPARFDVNVGFAVTRDGVPVDDASVSVAYDMLFMTHGPFTKTLTGIGGEYASDYDLFMFGPWGLEPTITIPGSEPLSFQISVYVWPD